MAGLTPSGATALVASAPPVLTGVAWLAVIAISGITGQHPLWNIVPRNLAEAAASRDSGAIVRMAERGDDLTRAGDVRPGIIFDDPATLTPLEAAAASRDSTMVQLLIDLGVAPDAAAWQRAWCLSTASSVQEVLEAHQPAGARKDCDEAR